MVCMYHVSIKTTTKTIDLKGNLFWWGICFFCFYHFTRKISVPAACNRNKSIQKYIGTICILLIKERDKVSRIEISTIYYVHAHIHNIHPKECIVIIEKKCVYGFSTPCWDNGYYKPTIMTNTLHSYGGVFFLHHHHDSIFTTLVSLDNYDVWKKSSVFCPGAEKRRVVLLVVVVVVLVVVETWATFSYISSGKQNKWAVST